MGKNRCRKHHWNCSLPRKGTVLNNRSTFVCHMEDYCTIKSIIHCIVSLNYITYTYRKTHIAVARYPLINWKNEIIIQISYKLQLLRDNRIVEATIDCRED